ncbi:hypothetical protein [Leptospira kmetyi]|uniref:hypothetical protein n=1 Tax=Leptospira kmetyi TaxID=408139 RepID=UPI00108432D1|nr:hypothetical protein [Leptospira kmetyi]TGK21420.1 hypothetical protein EHO62_03125 [Leptospira kmetyi]TGK28347.1 hypothetical protein EHO66_12605 [Leptospira kmetyi]
MSYNSNQCNIDFDREIDNFRNGLRSRIVKIGGLSDSILLDRLSQRVVEIGRYPYAYITSLKYNGKTNSSISDNLKLDFDKAWFELGSGKVSFNFVQYLRNQFDFLFHWLFCLVLIIRSIFDKKKSKSATLIFGVGEESLLLDNTDARFIEYCSLSPILPLRNGGRFLIQSIATKGIVSNDRFSYSKNPFITLFRESKFGFYGRLSLLTKHVILLLQYLYASLWFPELILIGKDLAYLPLVSALDTSNKIESLILTCSFFNVQSLWMRVLKNSKVHMIWYAQNWQPIVYSKDSLRSNISFLRWIRVDHHWVWTKSFGEYLKYLIDDTEVTDVGPIVWYLPSESPNVQTDKITISIFDVSPYSDSIALKACEFPNYNSPENLLNFVRTIVSLKDSLEKKFGIPVTFKLKTKRGFRATYDRAYFDYIEALDRDGILSLEYHQKNIYELIANSSMVVVYPFSSPAYVAEFLKIAAVYFDPTGSIVRWDFSDTTYVKFVNSAEGLFENISTELESAAARKF